MLNLFKYDVATPDTVTGRTVMFDIKGHSPLVARYLCRQDLSVGLFTTREALLLSAPSEFVVI